MALPTTTNDVTTRRLGTAISSLWTKIKNTFQTIGNKVTSWSSTPSDTKYPSEKLVKDALDGKVSSITKNGTSITPTNGVADIGNMPVTRGQDAGTVQEIIQAVRVKAGGSIGSVNVRASTVGSVSIPAKWYNYIWLPHQSGRDSGDNQHYGTLILTPLTESPDVYVIEGSALNGSSPTYRAKRLAYYDHTHSNLVPEGDNRSVSTIPDDYSNTFVFRGIKNNSAIDNPSSDTYSYVIGLRGYQNSSGGRAHEIAFNDSGVFFRSGSTTSWTAWGKLITDETLFLYANLGWGGKFRTSLSPVDVYLFYNQNAFFGLKPSAVDVEYSNDGGTTWTDYGLTDDQKRQFFSQYNGCQLYCGRAIHVHPGYTGSLGTYHDLSNENIADQRLRITLGCLSNAAAGTSDNTDKWIYCNLRRLAVYMSTQSASKGPTHFKITGRRKPDFVAGNDVWRDLGDYGILGDSGWNSVPCLNEKAENKITFGNSYDEHYTQLRFEIWSESLNTTPNSGQTGDLMVQKILGFSELLWQNNSTNGNMATYGSPYTVNPLNGVTHFAKGITSGVAIPISSGGTGATTAIGAEYNILNQVADIDTTLDGDRKIALCNQSKSASNGVFRWIKLNNVWTWIKGKLSSDSGVNISGNSATATTAQNYDTSTGTIKTALEGKVSKSGDTMSGILTMEQPISQLITGTGTAGTSSGSPTTYYPAKWDFDLGIANPTPGYRMVIQIPVAGHDNGVFISTDNGTTYYPVARTTSTSRLTTHYPAKAYVCVIFEAYDGTDGCGKVGSIYPVTGGTARVTLTTGCWRVINDYDSGNTYERLYTGGYFYAGTTGCNPYSLVCMDNTGKFSMLISGGSGTGTSKTVNTTTKFTYPATMMYYSANNTAAAGARVTSASAYIAYPGFDCRYSCNYTTTFATHSATYIECTLNSDNTWTPTSNSITQTLRSGYYYIYLGNTTSTTYAILLHTNHPILYYDGTNLISAELTIGSLSASSTNGSISVAGTDVSVYTHPTQTAYSAKGSATKVPKITTDSTGHVTSIEEVTITGVTPASHSHGNIANGGTLTDTAAAAAGNDYVVIRDADNAKIQTSTIKGTDVADAVSKKHEHTTLTLSTSAQAYDGTHTLALPASDPYTSARTPASHTHGNIANGGTLTDTAAAAAGNDYVVIRDADNAKIQTSTIKGTDVADAVSKKHSHSTLTLSTTAQAYDGTHTLALPSSDPYTSARTPASHTHGNIANGGTLTDTAAAAAGNDYVVIRDADNAKIQTSTIKGTDVADAVSKKHGHSTLTLSTTAQAYDGTHTLALPASDPYTSARTPASHTHGNITNAGGITASGVTIANGDSLAIVDSSETNKLIAKSSVTFDGSTTTKALTQKGTFETFLQSHQDISGKEDTSNKVSSWSATTTDTHYPSEKLVKDSLDAKLSISDIDDELSSTSTNPVQNQELTRWHNIIIGEDGYVSGSSANPQLSLQKSRLGSLSLYNAGVNIKIYSFDENDEANATLEWDVSTASDSIKALYNKGEQTGTLYQSTAGKWVKIVYTGTTACYFRALGVFMDTKDTSSTVSQFYGHLRISGVDYPESAQFSTWGSLIVAAYSKSSVYTAELILRPKSATCACRIFGFRCLNTYTGSDAVLIGCASSAMTLSETLPISKGGTGATSATAAEYNILSKARTDLSANDIGDTYRIPFLSTSPSTSNGIIAGYRTMSAVWSWIKGKISSVLGITESNGVTSFSGNASNDANGNDIATNVVYYVNGTTDYPAWQANHAYAVNDNVVASGKAYTCKTAHTSGSSFATTNWNVIATPVIKGTVNNVSALFTGMKIALRWPITGGSSSTYLNINNLGNVYIRRNNGNTTTHLPANTVVYLTYDGTYWQWADYDSNSTYSGMVTAYVNNAGDAAKGATSTNFKLTDGVTILLTNNAANTKAAALTLNVNSTGAKALYINGTISSATNYTIPIGTYFCHYKVVSGTGQWHLYTDGTFPATKLALDNPLSVSNGGTGLTSVTSDSFLVGNGTGALVEKTAAQVLSLIGAQAAMTEMTTQEVTDFLTELGDF